MINIDENIPDLKGEFNKNGYVIIKNYFSNDIIKKSIKNIESCVKGEYDLTLAPDKIKFDKNNNIENYPIQIYNIWKSNKFLSSLVLDSYIGKIASSC